MANSGKTVRIAPSLLAADFARLAEEIAAAEAAGADWLHIDVMDGHFVPNLTLGPPVLRSLRKVTTLPLDVHLMIEEPERLIPAFAEAGANTLTVHVEACPHLHRTLQQIHDLNIRAGVSLNPHTPEDALRYILKEVDLVLVMSVNPGFGGQHFIPDVLEKISRLRNQIDEARLDVDLEVDGGINASTAKLVREAGADVLVAGSAVFGSGDYAQAIRALREV